MRATIPFLQERFETFNRDIFDGGLPPVPLKLGRARRSLGACTYKKRRKLFGKMEFYDFCIRISVLYDLPENELEDILLHEMIHYEILVNQLQDSSSHGKLFRSRMREINERFGRHIGISHKLTDDELKIVEGPKPKWRVVALVKMKDGRTGIKVLPRIEERLKAYRRGLKLSGQVESVEFYWSDDPCFLRFPKSSALNVFFPTDHTIIPRLSPSQRINL